MIHLSIDLETYSDVNLKKAGLYRYVQSPAFEILLFAYSFDGAPTQVIDMAQGEEIPMEVIHALTDPQCLKHAYNAAFEWYCLSKYMGAQLPPAQWRDTMLHGLYAGYTAGLDATGRALGIPEYFSCIRSEDLPQMAAWAEANPVYPVPVIFGKEDFICVARRVMP